MNEERKTPLYDTHVKYGGKIVPFGGYLLPVQYESGVIAEHMAVRKSCGMFDVSHMGEVLCQGDNALANLNMLMTNDLTGMADGQARYSPMCNDKGGVVDDLIIYKIKENNYFLVVNAANKDKDFAWMKEHEMPNATFTDISDTVGQIALQGPLAHEILSKLANEEDIPEKYYSCVPSGTVGGIQCLVSQTGYTGEDGYELYCPADKTAQLWEKLMEAGKDEGLIPCGLGARDTLRMEAGMPLYGHEMNDEITPLQTGLGFAVKMAKEDFIGKKAMEEMGTPTIKRIGLKITGRGIAREHMPVLLGDKEIGHTTSGTHAPYLGYPVAMALVAKESVKIGDSVEVEVRGRRVAAEVVLSQFYKKA